MDYAIMIYFEEHGENQINNLVQGLVRAGFNDHFARIDMRPHITLAELDTDDTGRVIRILEQVAGRTASISLGFSSFGMFPGEQGVLYLTPVIHAILLQLHRKIHNELESTDLAFSNLYQPENWIPHCTLGLDFSPEEIGQAYAWLLSQTMPILTQATHLVLYGCCPYQELMVWPLKPTQESP